MQKTLRGGERAHIFVLKICQEQTLRVLRGDLSPVVCAKLGRNHVDRDMERYIAFVTSAANSASGTTFFNEGKSHARIVLDNIFRISKNEVDILTSELTEDVFGSDSVIGSAIAFLRENVGAKISIISERPISDDHPFIDGLKKVGLLDRVEMLTTESAKQSVANFTVGDGQHFRFEPDKNKFNAICRFGDPKIGMNLKERFRSSR
jgi:hypothetical protein